MTKRPSSTGYDRIRPDVREEVDESLLRLSSEDEWERSNPRHSGRYPTPKSLRGDPRMPKPFYKTRHGLTFILVALLVFSAILLICFRDVITVARLRHLGVPPGLYSRDGVLVVGDAVPFMIKGFSWFGMEEDLLPGGLHSVTVDDVLTFARENNFNAIRLPLSVENVLADRVGQTKSFRNAELAGLTYINTVKVLVQKAADYDILVLLDMHRLEKYQVQSEGLWYTEEMPEERLFSVWKTLCQSVGDEWNVLGADLYNEPWDSLWKSANKSADWKRASERLGNAIHEGCPSWTIFIEGIGGRDNVTNTNPFWSENLRSLQSSPPVLALKNKVVLSPHVYGPSVHMQDYFKVKDFPNNMPAIWDDHFGMASEATGLATVIGEFGGFYKGKDKEWMDTFYKYIRERNIPFFFWCVNPDSIDTGGLLQDDWITPDADRLGVLESAPSTSVKKYAAHFKHWRNWRK